jgi:hypothetical protein
VMTPRLIRACTSRTTRCLAAPIMRIRTTVPTGYSLGNRAGTHCRCVTVVARSSPSPSVHGAVSRCAAEVTHQDDLLGFQQQQGVKSSRETQPAPAGPANSALQRLHSRVTARAKAHGSRHAAHR